MFDISYVRIFLLIWMIVLCDVYVYDGWVCSSDVEGNERPLQKSPSYSKLLQIQ